MNDRGENKNRWHVPHFKDCAECPYGEGCEAIQNSEIKENCESKKKNK